MSAYKKLNVRIRGVCPCIMNNGQKANPQNEWAKGMKAILNSKKRGDILTDDQQEKLQYQEFMGALYVDAAGRPAWPGENLEAMLLAAAKSQRRGKDCTIGLFCQGDFPLVYDGPATADKLYLDKMFHKVCMARNKGVPVLKCRPIFNVWELEFTIDYNPEALNKETIETWLEIAGSKIGLSDWRPKFGRFEVVSVK